jgi:iron(III) transport system permease protein
VAALRLPQARRFRLSPNTVLGLGVALVLAILVLGPLLTIVYATITQNGGQAWRDVLASDLSRNLFWRPLGNTLLVGVAVASVSVLIGGFLAWLVMLTDLPGRKVLGAFAAIPFVLPSFAIALAWDSLFRNNKVGGEVGLLMSGGLPIPDWLAWGYVPVSAVLAAHYFSLVFTLIAAALASINAQLIEAAEMTGANKVRILFGITLPVILPAVIAGALLAFAEAVSNFAVPALLGLPDGFYTLSTRLYGSISTGQTERGYVLAVLLIVVSAGLLWFGNRLTSGRRSFATIGGKGGRSRRFALGVWKYPMLVLAWLIVGATTIVPLFILTTSSLALQKGSLAGGLTLHYWFGASDPAFAQGLPGILNNPEMFSAALNTLGLGLSVAFVSLFLGLAIGYVLRDKTPLAAVVAQLSFLPMLIPGIALGAALIIQYGQPFGPIPSLYGSFGLLILAGATATLTFASQAGKAAMAQVSGDLEEASRLTGASLWRTLRDIYVPLTARGMIAGAVLVLVKMLRDLSLMILLVAPATPLLSIVAFRYANEGFQQMANGVTVIIGLLSVSATLLANRLQGKSQPWNDTE